MHALPLSWQSSGRQVGTTPLWLGGLECVNVYCVNEGKLS